MGEPWKPRNGSPRETDCGSFGSAEPLAIRRRPTSTSLRWNLSMFELPGVVGDGMPGRNGQRKTGTARGLPTRSRTAKAVRISRRAVKSRCAREWGAWGRLSEDGSRQHNSNRSEGPWGRWGNHRMAVHYRAHGPAQYGVTDVGHEVHEGRRQTMRRSVHAGSRLELADALGRSRLIGQPSSRTGENPLSG
jgi:hypothetical protein